MFRKDLVGLFSEPLIDPAVRELLIERRLIDPGEIRRQIEVLDSRTPALGAKVPGRSGSPGEPSGIPTHKPDQS
jgi:hypothetical protein